MLRKSFLIALGVALASSSLVLAQVEIGSLVCSEPQELEATGTFEFQPTQYAIEVPAEADMLEIVLGSTIQADIDLGISFEQPVETPDLGNVLFFLASTQSIEGIRLSRDQPPQVLTADGQWVSPADHEVYDETDVDPALRLQPGTYFAVIGNPDAADPNPARITATWSANGVPCAGGCSPFRLAPNEPVQDQVEGSSFSNPQTDEPCTDPQALSQYAIDVAEGSQLLAVELKGIAAGNLDLYISVNHPVTIQGPLAQADFILASPDDKEVLILNNPRPGTYWIVVENRDPNAARFTLTALPLFDIVTLDAGGGTQTASGSVTAAGGLIPLVERFLRTSEGLLSLQQFRVDVPQGARRLVVELEGLEGANVNLHLRAGERVAVNAGQLEADLSSISVTGQEALAVSGQLLQPGPWFIAVEGIGPLPQSFTLRVTVETDQSRSTSLTIQLKGDSHIYVPQAVLAK